MKGSGRCRARGACRSPARRRRRSPRRRGGSGYRRGPPRRPGRRARLPPRRTTVCGASPARPPGLQTRTPRRHAPALSTGASRPRQLRRPAAPGPCTRRTPFRSILVSSAYFSASPVDSPSEKADSIKRCRRFKASIQAKTPRRVVKAVVSTNLFKALNAEVGRAFSKGGTLRRNTRHQQDGQSQKKEPLFHSTLSLRSWTRFVQRASLIQGCLAAPKASPCQRARAEPATPIAFVDSASTEAPSQKFRASCPPLGWLAHSLNSSTCRL